MNDMLVLTRKLDEKIRIGDDIIITIVKINKDQIRIGIEAPDNVKIYREEIFPAGPIDGIKKSKT